MLEIVLPEDVEKIKKGIVLLELQISKDTNLHDKEIHLFVLKEYKEALKRGVDNKT